MRPYDGTACASAFCSTALLSTLSPPSAAIANRFNIAEPWEDNPARGMCEGGVAHVLIHILGQEERGRGGYVMQGEA